MNKTKTNIHCSSCGAAHNGVGYKCNYCESALIDATGKVIEAPIELKDFGWKGNIPLIVTISGSIILYFFGWKLEQNNRFVNDNVMIVWCGVIPLWNIFMSCCWKTNSKTTYLTGLLLALPFFPLHLFMFPAILGRYLNKDSYGYAGILFGIIWISWIAGRIIHKQIRKRISKE